ncbi:MAG TPA: phosphoribosyltransferase family protein [Burkholderiaceae bacterium]
MFRRLIAGLSAAVPSQCAFCHSWPAQPVCGACMARFARPLPRCRTCALPLAGGTELCGGCLRHPPPLDICIAAVDYAYPWSDAIARLKFQHQPGWAAPLAALLHAAPGAQAALAQADLLLPMPLAAPRLRERGYNQAQLLARQLAPGKVDSYLLLRPRATPPQAGLARAQRLRNVRGAFAVEPLRAHELRGKSIALVDDVMTSGASLCAAAHALRAAGARSVAALVVARTPEP